MSTNIALEIDTEGRVVSRHYRPGDLTEAELENRVIVESIPEQPALGRGEMAVLYYGDGAAYWQIESRPLSDDERLDDVELKVGAVAPWEPGLHYLVGEQRSYATGLYRCLQEHTAHDPGWTPEVTPALWGRVGSVAPSPTDYVEALRELRPQLAGASNVAQLREVMLAILDVLTGDD